MAQALEEGIDGVRLAYNTWPSTRLDQIKMTIPLGVMYTPLNKPDEINRCNYKPLACRNEKCGAVLSPWSEVDMAQQIWTCPLCLTRNAFPPQSSPQQARLETNEEMTTIEYEPQVEGTGAPAFLFVVDTCILADELEAIKSSIQQALALLPSDAMIGLITYGKHVHVHEIGFPTFARSTVFRGDVPPEKWKTHMTIERFKQLLEINPQDEQSILRYLQPLESIEAKFNEVLEDITIDKWRPSDKGQRPDRATGVAVLIGVSLLSAAFQGYPARLMVFTGGAPTVGPGKIVEGKFGNHIRQYRDLEKGTAPLFDGATKYYTELANHAVSNKHVIDLFACCLDQTGVAEQRVLVDHTGGVLVLSDTFRTPVFQESFSSLFISNATEELSMCFDAEIKIRTSRQIKVNACLGPVTRITEKVKSNSVSNNPNEIGIGGTSKWSIGGIYPSTTFCFVFDISSNQTVDDTADNAYIQFQTTYKTSYGTNVTRVTTIAVALANINKKESFATVCESMDYEAATVVLARWAVHKADTEFMCPLMNWLDREIIKFCRKVGSYQKGDADSFRMPKALERFPESMYYLRRSQFIHPNDYSLDESAFFKCTLMRENVTNTMAMIQPLLYCYTMDDETLTPVNVELEYSSRHPDVILLLDSFFHLVIWYGANIASWRNNNTQADPEYAWFGDMLQAPKDECSNRAPNRFPYPNIIECDEGSGQERFLIAKMNPNIVYDEEKEDDDRIHTQDASLKTFLKSLKKMAVTMPE